jgi:glycosyltransferase involved in cell wall biosynthesis
MLLSIIVPVYNVEDYLVECLDSINKRQDLDSYEVICINDGSTDRSLEVLKVYARANEKIKIISISNHGLSAARNLGIAEAKGEYVLFVDSDDMLFSFVLKDLLSLAKENDLDILDFNTCSYENRSLFPWRKRDNDYNHVKNGKKYFTEYVALNKEQPNVSAWSHVYRRGFLIENGLFFVVGRYYEDLSFTAQAYARANRVMAIDKNIYIYRVNFASITKLAFDCRRLDDLCFTWKELIKISRVNGLKIPLDCVFSPMIKGSIELHSNNENIISQLELIYFDRDNVLLCKMRNRILYRLLTYNYLNVLLLKLLRLKLK